MKYGAVNVASQAAKKPTAVARPKVYDRSRCEGSSPPEIQAYVATIPYGSSAKVQQPIESQQYLRCSRICI